MIAVKHENTQKKPAQKPRLSLCVSPTLPTSINLLKKYQILKALSMN